MFAIFARHQILTRQMNHVSRGGLGERNGVYTLQRQKLTRTLTLQSESTWLTSDFQAFGTDQRTPTGLQDTFPAIHMDSARCLFTLAFCMLATRGGLQGYLAHEKHPPP